MQGDNFSQPNNQVEEPKICFASQEKKKCNYCHEGNPDEARYCMHCGAPMSDVKGKSYNWLKLDKEELETRYNSAAYAILTISYSMGMFFTHRDQSFWWALLEAVILFIPFAMGFIFIWELYNLILEKVKNKYCRCFLYILILLVCAAFFRGLGGGEK